MVKVFGKGKPPAETEIKECDSPLRDPCALVVSLRVLDRFNSYVVS